MVIVLYVTIIFTSFISLLWLCIVFLRGRTAERRSGLRKAQDPLRHRKHVILGRIRQPGFAI
jgi:hypothetical protein